MISKILNYLMDDNSDEKIQQQRIHDRIDVKKKQQDKETRER